MHARHPGKNRRVTALRSLLAAALLAAALPAAPALPAVKGAARKAEVLEARTIARQPDPVILQGSDLLEALDLPLDGFRLYARRDGKTAPIPFDINERDQNGDYVLPQGKEPTTGIGRWARTTELAYMAHDTGDRLRPSGLPAGWSRGFEIVTTDPVNGQKGWAYLLHFEGEAPERSKADYVSIREVAEPDPLTGKPYAVLEGKYFHVRNIEGSTSWYDFRGTRAAGYVPKSFSDHVQVRNRLKMFGFIPFSVNEDTIWSETPAYYDGAVRFIRRVKLKVILVGIKVPTGTIYDVTGYDRIANVPVKIKIPAVVKAASRDAWAWYGLDLNPSAAGKYTFYSNTHPEGIPITGKNGTAEKSFGFDRKELVPSKLYWSVVTGPYGTLMRRHLTPKDLEERGVRHFVTFMDDEARPNAPEYYKGQVGNVLTWLELESAPYGELSMGTYWYYPPRFKYPDDVQTYLNILDNPIASKAVQLPPPEKATEAAAP